MLEAREVCSGATARNGGHLNPPLYHDYSELKEKHGKQAAKTIIRFRLQHLQEIRRIAEHEDVLKQSQCRETEHIDVFTDADVYARAKEKLAKWKADMPSESDTFGFCDQEEAIKRYRLADDTIGCIYGSGGAMHPYRLVTSLLALLLDRHSGHFCIATQTPCTDISGPTSSSHQYTVTTPRGSIKAPHVIHATNGWCSHLLPPLRAKIVPARGTMSAQRPGTLLAQSTLSGLRSYVFYRGTAGYDYLTQLPNGEHELMFGGGFAQCYDDADIPDIGLADDATVPFSAACHLAGALPLYFGSANWGGESAPTGEQDARWGTGRTKAQWSGVLGISTDSLPWVGRLPEKVAGRPSPSAQGLKEGKRLAAPGEWIAAGYSGEGMVHAWMSGKALAYMVLDREEEITEWFPDILRVTEKRWKKATVDDLISKFM
ncbi:FAD dependent oxidoreductase [Wolfiporia cocos MD-104 SS10]|uniref:FAD dependent oxidoreductase n=1 Tax=Wolfiporia cocos (strain MD-104) TaxID=742152 RepID=A0A2H3J051_WOLCO|nr:FAD dependent oxidoreductase [Wolfiporia cocos MD-104 SS10]